MTRSAVLMIVPLMLAGCGQDDKPKPAPKPSATASKAAKPFALPPSIAASKSYRCKDGSLLYVDYLSDDLSANVSTVRDGPVISVKGSTLGGPKHGAGLDLDGSKDSINVTVTVAGAKPLSCHR